MGGGGVGGGCGVGGGGGAGGTCLLYLFAEIGRLTLCGGLRDKGCTKLCELTFNITFFLHFSHPPQITPAPTGVKVPSVLILGTPSLKKS